MKRVLWAMGLVCLLARAASGATELAVTVDDLPAHGALPRTMQRMTIAQHMISVLKQHAVPEVYGFVNGGQIRDHPERADIVKIWLRAGFRIGNHTFSHLDINRVTAAEYIADIERNEAVLAELAGPRWPRVFRYPYLHEGESREKREAVRRWLAARGYAIAQVTVTFDDWAWNNAYARCVERSDDGSIEWLKRSFLDAAVRRLEWSRAVSHATFGRQIRHVLLLHVGGFVAEMLDGLLGAYRKVGVKIITLDEAMADPVYQLKADTPWHGESTFLFKVALAGGVSIPTVPEIPLEKLDALCP
jgi:peptidoglycan/xylan/chitin deacetylase (PgdA/CDA1 family)